MKEILRKLIAKITVPENSIQYIPGIITSLFIFCAVFLIQIKSGFQQTNSSLLLMILSAIVFLTCCITFLSHVRILKFKKKEFLHLRSADLKNNINTSKKFVKGIFILSLLFSAGFFYMGFNTLYEQKITYTYPIDGSPVSEKITMSGTFRNVDNNTLIWLYTFSDGKYYIEYLPSTKIYGSKNIDVGQKEGYWFVQGSYIGSNNTEESTHRFTLGYFLIDNSYWMPTLILSHTTPHGMLFLPPWAKKVDESLTVFLQ